MIRDSRIEPLKKHAAQIMAQSGNPDDIEPDSYYGGFKKVQVRFLFLVAYLATKFSLQVTGL